MTRFNPRPPLPGGDASGAASGCSSMTRFNPRPPLPGGDAGAWRFFPHPSSEFQSTPPVAGGRCLRCVCHWRNFRMFQSTPPVAGGRCVQDSSFSQTIPVSIHAPRCRGAMRLACRVISSSSDLFQSTPPVAGGRCHTSHKPTEKLHEVSIHAPRCRGAMRIGWRDPNHVGRVSIHAPRCRGAMRPAKRGKRPLETCFNPRPPLPGGDAATQRLVGFRGGCLAASHVDVFQSTPPVAGGRCKFQARFGMQCTPLPARRRFNPRPPLPGGDASRRSLKRCCCWCFNPRPPLPGGDACRRSARCWR